jgi:hypothetical protein
MIARFTEKNNTCDVLFCGGGEKKLDVFFPPEKPKMRLRPHHSPKM